MTKEKKRHSILKWAVLTVAFLIVIAIVFLNSYIGSRSFIETLERKAGEKTPFTFEIGSINLSGISSISLNDLVLTEKGKEVPFVKLGSAKVGFSLLGLLRREVKSIDVEALELSIDLTEKKGKEKPSALNSIQSPPPVPGEIKKPQPLPVISMLKLADLRINIKHLKEDGTAGLVKIGPVLVTSTSERTADGVRFNLNTKSISKHFKVEDPHEIELSGVYDEVAAKLTLDSARLSSALIGSVEASGVITNIGSPGTGVDIALKVGPLKLAGVDALFLPADFEVKGVAKGGGAVKGSLDKELNWTTDFSLAALSAKALGYNVDVTKEPIRLTSKGTVDLSTPASKPIIKGESALSLTGLSFSDGEGQIMGEGVDFEVSRDFRLIPDKESGDYNADFTATALLKGFEFVAGGLYLDFTDREISLSTEGAYQNESLRLEDSLIKISDIASLAFKGKIAGLTKEKPAPVFDLSLGLKALNNAQAYEVFLKDSIPALAGFDISGSTELEARLKGTPSGFSLLGELNVKDTALVKMTAMVTQEIEEREAAHALPEVVEPEEMEPLNEEDLKELEGLFSAEEIKAIEAAIEAEQAAVPGDKGEGLTPGPAPPVSIKAVDLKLPFYLTYPNTYRAKPKDERSGLLSIGEIMIGETAINDLSAEPLLWGNRFSFLDELTIPIFSGVVAVRDFLFEDIISPKRELSFGIDVGGIRLSEVGAMLGLPPFSGTLTGSIPIVTLSGRSLRTDGLIELSLFDGRVGIRGIEMDNLLSPIASFKSSIEIDSLNLAELTDTFEFGRISGILTGYVQDLVIMNGLPVSFSIQMETVRTRGVAQRINVKALKKIQVFSSGASVSILDKGIYRFFKEYGYKKMGFSGRLADDRFSLLGIEETENKRYIIVGSLRPPRVDVVSYTHDISFAELIKRLKRVQQTE